MPGGRPTAYNTTYLDKVKEYMKACPDKVPSLCGFAMTLDVCESTLKKWKALSVKDLDPDKYPQFDEFLHLLDKLMDLQKITALNGGVSGDWNSTIAKLVLTKHGYSDKTETKHEGLEAIMPVINVTLTQEKEK